MAEENNLKPVQPVREVNLTRILDAPRDLVFKAWTDPQRLAVWWGPHGFTNPACELDLRPGGVFRICMDSPEFPNHWVDGLFLEVIPGERLVFTNQAFRDIGGHYGLEVLNTITFSDYQGKTKLTVKAVVTKLDPKRQAAYDGMEVGWTQSLDRLDALLENAAVY